MILVTETPFAVTTF